MTVTDARPSDTLHLLRSLTAHSHPSLAAASTHVVQRFSSERGLSLAVLERRATGWEPIAASLPLSVAALQRGPAEAVAGLRWIVLDDLAVVARAEEIHPDAGWESLACWLALHQQRDRALGSERSALAETDVVRAVTEQLRSVRDLDEVLHSIARRTLDLLDADICGVLLREDAADVVRMRSCVGNRMAETAKLAMRRGQGVAGLVFATGDVVRVDEYLEAETISRDFMDLAGREETRSAFAVPLTRHGELIGVLEVWRRRASVFTDLDVQRMLTLADFATIAIANARLYEEQERMLGEIDATRVALESEVALSRRTASLQRRLMDAVLRRPTLAGLAEVVSDELGCAVGIYGPERQAIALRPDRDGQAPPGTAPAGPRPGAPDHVAPVAVEGEALGSVLLRGAAEESELLAIACNQVGLAVSLAHLHERAASRARAEALEQAMWDLLSGPIEARLAARSRAQQIGVDLSGRHLVVYGWVDGLASLTGNANTIDRTLAELWRSLRRSEALPRHTLVGARGDHLVAVLPVRDGLDIRELLSQWSVVVREVGPTLSVTWGVSRTHTDSFSLATAFDEAKVALSAALRLGSANVSLYDELGIVRLLLGSGSDPDLQSFVTEVTGPLVEYDHVHDGSLVLTLRAFFDANCSQKLAAERLFIHHKTMRYRLERIRQLTGLDLSQHEDRMRADFALRLLQVHDAEGPGGSTP